MYRTPLADRCRIAASDGGRSWTFWVFFIYLSDDDGEDVSSQLVPQKDSITHLHPASLPTPPTTTPLPSLPSELRPSPGPSASDRRRRGGCRL